MTTRADVHTNAFGVTAPIRVLHIIKALGRGGAEVLLVEGLAAADRDRFDFRYGFIQSRPDEVANDLRARNAPVHCFHLDGNLKMLLGAIRVARFLKRERIDLVHAHLPMAGVVARMAGRLAGVPVVYTEHSLPDRNRPLLRQLCRQTWCWQREVIAISEDVARSIGHVYGDRVPVRTVWNGVNSAWFEPSAITKSEGREQAQIPESAHVVGTVAVFRDAPEKRLDIWLQAAQRIHQVVPHAHFLLVGDGPLRGRLEEQAADLGIGGVTHFVGRQADVRPFLAAMDVFLMSSAFEGFGIAPVEAMAMGVPVVATDVEGVRNVIDHGRTGLLAAFDANVAQSLAASVVSLLENPERRAALASDGRREVEQRFSIVRMQRELEEIYERVILNHRQAS